MTKARAFSIPKGKQSYRTLIHNSDRATAWLWQNRKDMEWLRETFLPNYRERKSIPIVNATPNAVPIAIVISNPIGLGNGSIPSRAKKPLRKRRDFAPWQSSKPLMRELAEAIRKEIEKRA